MIIIIERKANHWIHLLGEGATTCRAALLACLAMQKNTLRGQPLTYYFATPIKPTEPLYRLFNCGFQV